MECNKCSGRIVMHMMTDCKCFLCSKEYLSGGSPGTKICRECSEDHNVCEFCGQQMKQDEDKKQIPKYLG